MDYISESQIQLFEGKQVTEIENAMLQTVKDYTNTKLLGLQEKKSN